MPNIHHPDWDEEVGACAKHGIPMTPCPQCLADEDPDIQVTLSEADRNQLSWHGNLKVTDMFPADKAWLAGRIMS